MNLQAERPAKAAGLPTVHVNDVPHELRPGTSLAALLAGLGMDGRPGLAAALNGAVVRRGDWDARLMADGDRVLVIRATQGG